MTIQGQRLAPTKFRDRLRTANGECRAHVTLKELKTLWFNTGTLCNLACRTCYIESSPRNDRLSYLKLTEVRRFLDESAGRNAALRTIGFTGGEPFMNPDIIAMLELALARGYETLVLTNAMRPMRRHEDALLELNNIRPGSLIIRVSLDHYTQAKHEAERGADSWDKAIEGLRWLGEHGFCVKVAGRRFGEEEASARAGYQRLFEQHGLQLDAREPADLVLFPDMDPERDVPEITEACWGILKRSPDEMMCASSRMVVQRKGSNTASVVACTLLPYDSAFELGTTLAESEGAVFLNHPFCAQFCVLGGASCTSTKT